MKFNTTKNIAVILFFLAFIISSCSKSACEDVACSGKGQPDESNGCVCMCNNGYESDDCSVEMRSKFLGNYTFTDECGAETYNAVFSKADEVVTKILISNILGHLGGVGIARINDTYISLDSQTVTDNTSELWTVQSIGSAIVDSGSFMIPIQAIYHSDTLTCIYSYKKVP